MGELDPLYRRIDELLELRARDYPRRVEPTWSELQRSFDELSGRLREKVHEAPPGSPPVWPLGEALEAPVFVVGYPKSGTTLLNGLLDAHPQLLVIPSESKHFSDFGPDTGGLARDGQLDALQARWVPRLINPTGQAPFWLLGRPLELADDPYLRFSARLYALGHDRPGQDLLSVLAAALESSGDAGIRAWVEKTPD